MAKKIIILTIIITLFVAGGLFLFLKNSNIWQNNPFLASIVGSKPSSVLSESDLLPLKEKIAFLENKLEERESELEHLDDLAEGVDLLSQKITELETEFQSFKITVSNIEAQKEIKENEELNNEADGEEANVEQNLCEKISGNSPVRNKIIINEVVWMGSADSSNDEWLELKNISSATIDLSGWQILSKSGNIKTILSGGRVSPNSLFLLERTDDNSAPGVAADLVYAGAIKNSEEALYLFDKNCQLQDEVIASPDWPAGDTTSKRTMERKSDLTWQTSLNPGGTPKKENSSGYPVIIPSIPASGGSGGGGSGAPPPVTYPKILISEIQIEGEKKSHDFIELYNSNSNSVDLSKWRLKKKDKEEKESSLGVLPTGSVIPANGYFLWASGMDEDYPDLIRANISFKSYYLTEDNSIALLSPDDTIISALAWGSSTNPFVETFPFSDNPSKNQSLARIWDKETAEYKNTLNNSVDFEIQTPTPKERNNSFPIASFTFPSQNLFVGDEISFDASSSNDPDGTIATYIWDFGDGNSTSTYLATTTHSFATSNDFLITLEVIDDLGATSSPATTTINVSQVLEISDIQISDITENSALIHWETNKESTSKVEYGLTAEEYKKMETSADYLFSHCISLTNLEAETTYHFRVSSTDRSGTTKYSEDNTFITPSSTSLPEDLLNP